MAVYSINVYTDLHNADVTIKNYVVDQQFDYHVYQPIPHIYVEKHKNSKQCVT